MRTIPPPSKIPRRFMSFPFGALAVLIGAFLAASSSLLAGPPQTPALPEQSAPPQKSSTNKLQLAQAWIRELFGTGVAPGIPDRDWRRRESEGEEDLLAPRERPAPFSGTYTVCVRLCDGFYFPISFSTSRSHFAQDAKRCEESCPARARLFVHPTGASDEAAHMTDLQGKPYSQLPNAYRSKTEYIPDCTCRGNPWDAQELARHRAYADAANKNRASPGERNSKTATTSSGPSPRRSAAAERRMREED